MYKGGPLNIERLCPVLLHLHFPDLLQLPSSIFIHLFVIYHFPHQRLQFSCNLSRLLLWPSCHINLASLKALLAAKSVQKSHQPGETAGEVQLKTVQETSVVCDLSPALQ